LNASDETIIATILGSAEYFTNPSLGNNMNSTWLNQVYRDVLGRDRDPAAQGWLDALNSGSLTRLQVATDILASDEYRIRLIGTFFNTYLGRAPTQTATFLSQLQQGATDEHIISQIVASPEYFLRSHPYP
jgi:hypothetical protein